MSRKQRTENREQRTGIRDQGGSAEFEETLRLLAHLSAPEGLEKRIETGLRVAQHTPAKKARILRWPVASPLESAWLRAVAAAVIVAVAVVGGWGVYSRVRTVPSAKVTVMPPHIAPQGGFSNAGAMRTPQTLKGPIVATAAVSHPVAAAADSNASAVKDAAQPAAPSNRKSRHRARPAAAKKAAAEPAATAAQPAARPAK
jgi:hypothetical protein